MYFGQLSYLPAHMCNSESVIKFNNNNNNNSTFLGQALNGKRCKAVAPTLDKMSTIAVIISQYLKNDLR